MTTTEGEAARGREQVRHIKMKGKLLQRIASLILLLLLPPLIQSVARLHYTY